MSCEPSVALTFPPVRRSALHAEHRALGALLTPFAGWDMPLRYSGDVGEHHAVRAAAGLFDLSHMGEIALRGSQAGQALDFALVGNLTALRVGGARYTMLCAADGGVLDDLVVYRTAEHEYMVVANAANTATVVEELLARSASYDVVVADETEHWSLLGLQGPAAAVILSSVLAPPLDELRYYASMSVTFDGRPVLLARTGYTGEDGFEIFVRHGAAKLWRLLLERGAPHGLVPAGLACRDSLRLEAGMPLYGNELTVERSPFEAGLGRVVRFDKAADFVGRDALRRRANEPAHAVLVGLMAEGRAPRAGHQVLDGVDGAQIGTVTSGLPSPTLGRPIAMAYVDAVAATPGTRLAVDVRGKHEAVRVVELPFYRRSR